MDKYFSTNASFQVVEKDFLAIEYHKIFYRLDFLPTIGEEFPL